MRKERAGRSFVNRYDGTAAILRRDFSYASLLLAAILDDVEFEELPQDERGPSEFPRSHMAPARVQYST
jgi:hypothetical protein